MAALNTRAGVAERIVQQSPDALLLVDSEGHIAYVNEAAVTLFGYCGDELVGQPIEILVPDRARGVHERYRQGFALAPATREMGARIVALAARRKDGVEFPAEIRLAPILEDPIQVEEGWSDGGGFVLAAVRDGTERRRMSD